MPYLLLRCEVIDDCCESTQINVKIVKEINIDLHYHDLWEIHVKLKLQYVYAMFLTKLKIILYRKHPATLLRAFQAAA